MPSEIMDQRGASASSRIFEDIRFPPERQVGFWKQNTMSDHQGAGGMIPSPVSTSVASSPLEKLSRFEALSVDHLEPPLSNLGGDQKDKLGIGREDGIANLSETSWNYMDNPKSWSNLCMQPASFSTGGNKTSVSGIQRESSLFSNSLSEIFSRNLRLLGKDVPSRLTVSTFAAHHEEEEPFDILKEIEAHTIGNLLPDEDDLFSGVMVELGHNSHAHSGDDIDDFDLFSSGGGMELEGDDRFCLGQNNSDFIAGASAGQGGSNSSIIGEHPYGEHPSRTLFVRNINSNVEDSELKALFEQYGDIRTLYTACKHRGFVMISYYDIRAAQKAMRALQNKPLRRRKLDIHYSIPKDNPSEKDINQGTLVVFNLDSSVSTDELHQLFGAYGEIKEIRDTPNKQQHKFIEFYDVRSAEAALRSLNRSDIAGKQIKLEPSRPGVARRCLTKQSEQEQDELNFCQSHCDDLSSGHIAAVSLGGISSTIRSPLSAFMESHQSSSVPNNLPSPARVASISKKFSLCESNQSLDEMKFSNQSILSFHPHSFPEYHDNLDDGISYNSSSPIPDMAGHASPIVTEGSDNSYIRGLSSNGQLMEINRSVFESTGNGSCTTRPGNHLVWNNSNSHQHHPTAPMIWPNLPSFVNGVHSHRLPHMPGFSRVPLMLNSAPPVHHHIGSAPAVNHSLWDRLHAYSGESPEPSGFHMGSIGSVGFLGSSSSRPMEVASHIFSHAGGNCLDLTKSAGLRSPQQMCHLFPGRNTMISMPASFDSPGERVRNLSHRRNESNSNHADKKQYELDVDRILRGEDTRTTLMIKNIPNKYTSKMLLAAIDEHCRGTYDFIYLPIDFKNKCNVGYAFINMISPSQIIPFYQAFNGKKWEKFNSEKVASLAYARIQGKSALIAHFQNSSLMNEDKRCRPILFHTEGPNAGDQEPFPMGTNIRSRPGKPRTTGNEENYRQGSYSTSANGEELSNGMDSLSGSSKDSD
ncbi:RRM_1 domain-containing protein/RRM_2 domain-containing protein [Cephalotus follicularis]|uniref:RRM_1 domain-containing protein/RRM_2 domain-containing protein n=1 Tax=Cephalotus follicularis TaxID=3775 RepID=A0A1Q3AWV2_CEPFO|nr:RRM_1 domain-containing protein/RRM_2 domain-containing protein [Cephalotus follicularis]